MCSRKSKTFVESWVLFSQNCDLVNYDLLSGLEHHSATVCRDQTEVGASFEQGDVLGGCCDNAGGNERGLK